VAILKTFQYCVRVAMNLLASVMLRIATLSACVRRLVSSKATREIPIREIPEPLVSPFRLSVVDSGILSIHLSAPVEHIDRLEPRSDAPGSLRGNRSFRSKDKEARLELPPFGGAG
jgi:hypothetical protein